MSIDIINLNIVELLVKLDLNQDDVDHHVHQAMLMLLKIKIKILFFFLNSYFTSEQFEVDRLLEEQNLMLNFHLLKLLVLIFVELRQYYTLM